MADELEPVVYDPTCTPCVLEIRHEHPAARIPIWPCLHCHNGEHGHCDGARQFCSCDCGLKGDWMTLALMVDLSSNNGTPDLRKHWDAGYRVLCLKVTEAASYAWTASHSLAREWHSFGSDAVVWHYHFLHPGSTASGAQQADWFYNHVKGDLRVGDRVVCDVETRGETGGEVGAFWARYLTRDPHTPRVDYGSPYFLRDNGIRPQHGEALWLAQYAAAVSFIPPGWTTWLAWQYTQTATNVPGIPGACDLSRLTPAAFPHTKPPAPAPTPTPTPAPITTKGEDVYLILVPNDDKIYATDFCSGTKWHVPDVNVLHDIERVTGRSVQNVSAETRDALRTV